MSAPNPLEPADVNAKVWRYGQLWKLLYAMEHKVLRFSLLDVLRRTSDPFEASVPNKTKQTDAMIRGSSQNFRQDWYYPDQPGVLIPDPRDLLPSIEQLREGLLRSAHASCWRLGVESEAMWQLYCGRDDGVVIQTTYAKLRASITDPHVVMGVVQYIDYEIDPLAHHFHDYDPAFHKRIAFEHEKELRLVRWTQDAFGKAGRDPTFTAGDFWKMQWPTIEDVIESIVVHPRLGDDYLQIVKSAVERVSRTLAAKVQPSSLSRIPVY
jgi:hypothetical protein